MIPDMTRMILRHRLQLLAFVGATVLATGCKDKPRGPNLAPSASALAPSGPSNAQASAASLKLTLEPASTASIDMPAPKEHIKGFVRGVEGTLDVDVANLALTRGQVKVDLTTLTMSTFDDGGKNETQTRHARTWLEVGDGDDGKLPEELKKTNRYAVYAIRSIDGLSAPDLAKVAAAPAAGDAVDAGSADDETRTVTMTSHGELLVHGHKVERDVALEATFHYAPGAAVDKPSFVTVKTKVPMRVVLAEHDVKPRDGFGKLAQGALGLLGTKVAEVADISLDLRARP